MTDEKKNTFEEGFSITESGPHAVMRFFPKASAQEIDQMVKLYMIGVGVGIQLGKSAYEPLEEMEDISLKQCKHTLICVEEELDAFYGSIDAPKGN